jgi:hypothetical protein
VTTPDIAPEQPVVEPTATVARRPVKWYDLAIAAFFGLLFAYLVWTAIGNAINFPKLFELVEQSEAVPWWLLIAAIVVPIAIYVVAFVVSLRRSPLITALVFLVALAAASAIGYSAIGIGTYIFQHLPLVAS